MNHDLKNQEMQAVLFVRRIKRAVLRSAGGEFQLHQWPDSLPFRATCWLLIFLVVFTSVPPQLVAQAIHAPPRRTPEPVEQSSSGIREFLIEALGITAATAALEVNRTAPKVDPPPLYPVFSDYFVTDAEITRARVFEEPLIPMGPETTFEENRLLANAINTYLLAGGGENVQPFINFLNQYPASAWRASLYLNLGIVYRRTGWLSKALLVWEQAWQLAKFETDLHAHAQADRAVGELAELNAMLGRTQTLESIFAELAGRNLRGPATEKISRAHGGLDNMTKLPQRSFRCGPLAVEVVRRSINPYWANAKEVDRCESTAQGTSLVRVFDLMEELGMDFQMAKREPGASVILPAVIHWKAGHFAALVREVDGRYLVQDPTFIDEFWISKKALDSEISGYCIVPDGELRAGWFPVSREEGATVWGRGGTGSTDSSATTCDDNPKLAGGGTNRGVAGSTSNAMADYSFHSMVVSLRIQDDPVGYTPPRGPSASLSVVYNQREANQPAVFSYSNLGPKWTFSWLSYIVDDPTNSVADAKLFTRSGGAHNFKDFNSTYGIYRVERMTGQKLARKTSTSYDIQRPDGSIWTYAQPDGASTYPRKVFLTKITDSQGNALTLTYDGSLRLVSVTDALGQVTTLHYDHPTDNLKITKVTDPFGRFATFDYNASGQLEKITDVIGIESEFTYGTNDFISSLTTPYGTTTFTMSENGMFRSLEATDPFGQKERLEYRDVAPGIAHSDPDNTIPDGYYNHGYMEYRSTYFWDKKAMEQYKYRGSDVVDYTNAVQFHWLHDDPAGNQTSRVLESVKYPLENRIHYRYPFQSNQVGLTSVTNAVPSDISRVLDDGTTQKYQYEYNGIGKRTKSIDPMGRTITFTYSTNEVDLTEVRQTTGANNELLVSLAYNSQHRPTSIVDASGRTNSLTWKANGHISTITNAKSETYTFNYDSSTNYLTSIVGPSGFTNSFTYDSYGRVATTTDSEGYTLTYEYDVLDRLTEITYPDSTTEQMTYNRLDQSAHKSRLGHWTRTFYDALRRPILINDAANRATKFEWCSCGSLEAIEDAVGNRTTWIRDLQGRPTAKVYADDTTTSYSYDVTGRLKSMTDALSQGTYYEYFKDNNLKRISYSNAVVSTPTVSFNYDTNYNRVTNMIDGVGTTTYGYNAVVGGTTLGQGRLASIDGPWSNDTISYTYDELGRVQSRAINSSTNSVSYDSLGRVTNAVNALGSFNYQYTNATFRLSKIVAPNGQTNTFDYYNNNGDQRLKTIHNKNSSGSTLSKFDYEYDAEGMITKWTQQADSSNPKAYDFAYDAVDQLISGTFKDTVTQSIVKRFVFTYDKAGNRTGEQIDNVPTQATFNNLNQMTANQSSGPLRFKGSINETGLVTVAGISAKMSAVAGSATNTFIGSAASTVGTNVVSVIAQDYNTNVATNRYSVVVSNLVNRTLLYDSNGNLTNDATRGYEWDAANRLTKISQSTNYVAFSYDGIGRRVQMVDVSGSSTNSNKRFLWCGTEICEQRDSSGGTVTKQFFPQGVRDTSTNYFYCRDHLGSIRELTDSSQAIRARYDYDPYGRVMKVSGDKDAEFLYTGHYVHQVSGLYLTLFRAYDPDLGRWLSRDPIGLRGGLNLYAYVLNNPIYWIDPLGLIVRVHSRDVRGSGGTGAHTWVEVEDKHGRTSYSGTAELNDLLGVKENYPRDYTPDPSNPETSSVVVPPPDGMTQEEWDEAVRCSAEKAKKKDKKRKYSWYGGDGGCLSGNCHTVTREILEGAGGSVPSNYNPPGANPGLHAPPPPQPAPPGDFGPGPWF